MIPKTLVSVILSRINNTLTILLNRDNEVTDKYVEWFEQKTKLNFGLLPDRKFSITNNHIYWAFLGYNVGSEEGKHRPVLVTRTSYNSPICTIIPLTTKRLNDGYWYHIDLESSDSTALVEQMRIIDKKRIGRPKRKDGKITKITQKDWDNIDVQINSLYRLKKL